MERRSISRASAIALAESGWWKEKPAKDVVLFQCGIKELCLPFDEFHRCMEEALGRPVWTHEFGLNWDGLVREVMVGVSERPSFQDILNLIPPEKRVVVIAVNPTRNS